MHLDFLNIGKGKHTGIHYYTLTTLKKVIMKKRLILILSSLALLSIAGYIIGIGFDTPKIFGIALNVFSDNGFRIYDVNDANGLENYANSRVLHGSSGLLANPFGIARKPNQINGQNLGILTALETNIGCGSGTAFYNVDLDDGFVAKLGTSLYPNGLTEYIKDIEFNPIDNKVYGIRNMQLIRVDSFGSACYSNHPPQYAAITVIGTLGNIGIGPFSVAFDYLGTCYIISANDHKVAKLTIPSVPYSGDVTYTAIYQDTSLSDDDHISEVSSCVSGVNLFIGTNDAKNGKSFFKWNISRWYKLGKRCDFDYTSTPKSNLLPGTRPH